MYLHEVIKFYKNNDFSVLFLKGYRIATIFLQIIYFMKRRAKLADSNMEFHGFFQLRRDTTGAWSVFHFLDLSYLPRTAAAKIDQKHKKSTFLKNLFFFIRLRENTLLTDFLKMCKKRFSGSRVSKF